MITKAQIKDVQALSKVAMRRERQCFIVEGPRSISDVLARFPDKIIELYAVEGKFDPNSLVGINSNKTVPCYWLKAHEFKKISQLVTPNEVLAIVRMPQALEIDVLKGRYLYLDGIQDPGNMGTIIRSAHWFDLDGIIMNSASADPFASKVVQATMASILSVPLVRSDDIEVLTQSGSDILAADSEGDENFRPQDEFILAIGQEGKGLSDALRQRATKSIAIKRFGEAESLNAAVAASILLSRLRG